MLLLVPLLYFIYLINSYPFNHVVSCVQVLHVKYALGQEIMYNTHLKSGLV